jgi:hypothetical protein
MPLEREAQCRHHALLKHSPQSIEHTPRVLTSLMMYSQRAIPGLPDLKPITAGLCNNWAPRVRSGGQKMTDGLGLAYGMSKISATRRAIYSDDASRHYWWEV